MSEEQRKDETEVEGHVHKFAGSDEPAQDENEVEGHGLGGGGKYGANDEPDDEVEGHVIKNA